MMRFQPLFHFLVALALLPTAARADPAFLEAKPDAIDSSELRQKRKIDVYLPSESVKDASARYETLYVLDGDWNTRLVVQIVEFMRQVGAAPPLIVVSVPNFFDEHGVNSRDHDLTPTVSSEQARSGGADAFLRFLKNELVPYVDAHYPSNRIHLIHGHSYGGLFLAYALLHEPALFDGYIVLDPALRWDNNVLDAELAKQLPGIAAKGKAIYVAGREEPAFSDMGIASAKSIFETAAPRDLHWKIAAYPAESHDSMKLKATYDGLRFVYQGYTDHPVYLVPNGGILVKGKPMFFTLDGGNFSGLELHYTVDGSEPSASSPKAEAPFAIADAEKTKVALLSNRGVFDRTIPVDLKSGSAIAPARGIAPGASWQIEFYSADSWPRLRGKAFRRETAEKRLEFAQVGREAFAARLSGNLEVPADGYYVLAAFTDKARVALSGKPLFEQDSTKGAPYRAFVVPLHRGSYPLSVEFLHVDKNARFDFSVFQAKDGEPEWWKHKILPLPDTERR